MNDLMKGELLRCLENEFGKIETGFASGFSRSIQIVKYTQKPISPIFVSTLGLSNHTNLNCENRSEWFMEFSPNLSENSAASVLDYFLSLVLNRKLAAPKRGSYVEFPNANDRVWEGDNSRGLYFSVPLMRSEEFTKRMEAISIIPIWVLPVTEYEIGILNKKGWRELENYWDRHAPDLHSTFRK